SLKTRALIEGWVGFRKSVFIETSSGACGVVTHPARNQATLSAAAAATALASTIIDHDAPTRLLVGRSNSFLVIRNRRERGLGKESGTPCPEKSEYRRRATQIRKGISPRLATSRSAPV